MTDQLTIEQLYQKVKFSSYSEYLAEAVICFNARAYRASIIMTSNAVSRTIKDYIQELADLDLADAARVVAAMKEAENTGKTFEGVLENSLKSVAAFLPDDQLALREIRDKRNSAAHPSGYSGTRDDAYIVFKKAVFHFLS